MDIVTVIKLLRQLKVSTMDGMPRVKKLFLKYHKSSVVVSSDTDPNANSEADTDEDLLLIKNYLRTEFDVDL